MFEVLYEDEFLVVCKKPVTIPSQPDKTGDESMIDILEDRTKGEIFVVHRLDRNVGGVMVYAKDKKVAGNLCEQIKNDRFNKEYLAVVNGVVDSDGVLENYLVKNQRLNISTVTDKNNANGKKAVLEYKLVDTIETASDGVLSLLEINLQTGRHHQIRVQLSHVGFPIWGDTKYNVNFIKKKGFFHIALWAGKLSFVHPISNKKMEYEVKPDKVYPFELFYF